VTVAARRGGAPRRGRGRGGPRRKNDRPVKSAADLDAEMEVNGFRNQR
jgi:THO complex subunit 4